MLLIQQKTFCPSILEKKYTIVCSNPIWNMAYLPGVVVLSSKLKGIKNLQKKCIRNVANKNRLSHTDPIFSSLNVLKFADLFKYNSLVFMHNFAFGRLPNSFDDMFKPLGLQNRTGNYQLIKYKSNFLINFHPFIYLKYGMKTVPI